MLGVLCSKAIRSAGGGSQEPAKVSEPSGSEYCGGSGDARLRKHLFRRHPLGIPGAEPHAHGRADAPHELRVEYAARAR